LIGSLGLFLALVVQTANGQEAPCEGRFAAEEWHEAMDAVERAISSDNIGLAEKILDQIYDALRCSVFLVEPRDLGRFSRQMSLSAFYQQERDDSMRWASLDEAIDDTPWPDALPRPEAYVEMVTSMKASKVGGPEGRGLRVPKRGAVLIDGRLATRAEALTSSPHLVQVADGSGQPVRALWMDGAAFPEDLLGEPSVASRPGWYVDPDLRSRDREPPSVVGVAPTPVALSDETPSCPWKDIKKVSVGTSTVTINKTVYVVRTESAQAGFLDILYACKEYEAAGRFQKWRAARAINPFDGSMDRNAMLKALSD